MARHPDIRELEPAHAGAGLRIGIVMSRFNLEVCEGLLAACVTELRRLGVAAQDVLLVTVPGALEIPLAAQKMAQRRRVDAVCALGAVIRGETYHFEVVSDQSAAGLARVQLDTGVPIANGVLTTDDEHQAQARMGEKGSDAARVAVEMANLLRRLDGTG
jgi:6,7-dimethyl-8-ribityllumazine synthase